jgi:hypothetical protein
MADRRTEIQSSPWTFHGVYDPGWAVDEQVAYILALESLDDGPLTMARTQRDAALLAHASDRLSWLLSKVKRLEEENEVLEDRLRGIREY